jgi:serine/threonine protein kinase/tetratricopeptide (TPR) repeat protein
MSANRFGFKEKEKQRTKLREVCGDCGRIADKQDQGSTVTNWVFGLKFCMCKQEKPGNSCALAIPEASTEPPESAQAAEEIKADLGDRYEAIEIIGQGGMGTVYRARDKVLGKEFAVKVLRDELAVDESAIKRFEQEATAASDLTHVNMLAVYGHGRTATGSPYIVMDLLEGESLAQVLKKEHRLASSRILNIAIQICDALAHAHMKGLIHRDLKPSNIMLIENDMIKVLDFGIAKLMPSANRETQNLTQTGELFGSPSYMSPEQCLGCNQDARSDIYSLGCMMYEMLTGKPPFDGKNPIQTVVRHINEEPPSPSKSRLQAKIPAGLESVIMRCLEKSADERYQSMDQLKSDLQLVASGRVPKQLKKRVAKPVSFFIPLVLTITCIAWEGIFHRLIDNYQSAISTTLDAPSKLLAIICFSSWTYVLARIVWKDFHQASLQSETSQGKWRKTALGLVLLGSLAFIGSMLGYADVPIFNPPAVRVVFDMLAAACALLALSASLGWALARGTVALNLSPTLRRCLDISYIAALGILLIFARPLIAWIPFSIGNQCNFWSGNNRTDGAPNPGFEAAILINPDFADAYLARGEKKFSNGKPGAIDDLNKALNLSPSKPLEAETLRARARLYAASRLYKKAIADLSKVVELGPAGFGPGFHAVPECDYINRADYYHRDKQNLSALADYCTALSHDHYSDEAYGGRGKIYEEMGDYKQALSNYSAAIQWDPNGLQYYLNRAAMYKRLGNRDAALEDYKTVDRLFSTRYRDYYFDPSKSAQLYHAASVAEKELGREKEAQENLAKAIEFDKKVPAWEKED